jgi:tRNA(fMet)-specific endonuclease VapC
MAPVAAASLPQTKGEEKVIYILDTDVFTLAELPQSAEYRTLHARLIELEASDRLVTTIITYEEQTRGWLAYASKSRNLDHQIKAYSRLKKHLTNYLDFEILDFDLAAARQLEILLSLKIRIGMSDLKIAAIALSLDAVLVSRNLKDFRLVPKLKFEDWTR